MPVVEDNQGAFQYPATMTTTPIRGTTADCVSHTTSCFGSPKLIEGSSCRVVFHRPSLAE
jgi:hypothetical protein